MIIAKLRTPTDIQVEANRLTLANVTNIVANMDQRDLIIEQLALNAVVECRSVNGIRKEVPLNELLLLAADSRESDILIPETSMLGIMEFN